MVQAFLSCNKLMASEGIDVMNKSGFLFIVLWLIIVSFPAQVLWPEDVILRDNKSFEWSNHVLPASDGSVFTITVDNVFDHRNICLHKINADGNAAWQEPVIIRSGNSKKSKIEMFSSVEGDLFVSWQESNSVYLTKLNLNGEPLWDPAIKEVLGIGKRSSVWCLDSEGGLYFYYAKYIGSENYDIWAQHINSRGENLLPGDGIQVTADPRDENVNRLMMRPDGNMIFTYYITTNNTSYTRLMLMNADCVPLWQVNIQTNSMDGIRRYLTNIYCVNENEYSILWTEQFNSVTRMYLSRIDLQGNFLLPQPVLLEENITSSAVSQCANGDMIIALKSSASSGENRLIRVSQEGENVWGYTISLPDSFSTVILTRRYSDDSIDLWFRFMINDSFNYRYVLQHYRSDGEALNPGIGLVYLPSLYFNYRATITWNNQYFVLWENAYEGKRGLYYNRHDAQGALIGVERSTLKDCLNGSASLLSMQKRDNDVLVLLRDTRISNNDVYYQIVNPDGSLQFEENGRRLGEIPLYYNSVLHLDDNTTWIFYLMLINNTGYLYAQAILPSGDPLYAEPGQIVCSMPNIYKVENLTGSSVHNTVYLAWSVLNTYSTSRVYVQKVEQGIPLWGECGIMVSPNGTAEQWFERPLCFKDGFLVVSKTERNIPMYYREIWIQHLEPSGEISPNWHDEGMHLPLEINTVYYPDLDQATVYGDKLLICSLSAFIEESERRCRYYLMDSSGNTMVDNQLLVRINGYLGGLILNNESDILYLVNSIEYVPGLEFYSIVYGKLDEFGNQAWGDYDHLLESVFGYCIGGIAASAFPNGAYALSYWGQYGYEIKYIMPDGNFYPSPNHIFLSHSVEENTAQIILNNELYVAWCDSRNCLQSNSPRDIRILKLGNITTSAVSDESIPSAGLAMACYPNPFMQSCKLSITLSESQKSEISIYNLRGQRVKSWNMEPKPAGEYSLEWDGKDATGREVASGIYFARVKAGKRVVTRKMVKW